jgi:pyrroline-5-carboxylate reductase
MGHMTSLPTIAILGAGSMGGAILSGLTDPSISVDGIRVTNRTEAKAAALRSDRVESFSVELDSEANLRAVATADVVIVGVKPAMVPDLLREIAPALEDDAIVVSIAAGVTTASMEAIVPGIVIRAMPNTPAFIGRGVTGLSAGSRVSEADMVIVRVLFETVGTVLEVPESKIDALGTISGSGPAYVFYLIEQLAKTAVGMGFNADEARAMVEGTFAGASDLLIAMGETPQELRRRVTSPNGTTERAIAELEKADLAGLFDRATAAALARSRELAAG